MDRVILLHGTQIIPEIMTFDSIKSSGDVHVGGLINTWRLDKEYENTLLVSRMVISSFIK